MEDSTKRNAGLLSVFSAVVANLTHNWITSLIRLETYAFVLSLLVGLVAGALISLSLIYFRDNGDAGDFADLWRERQPLSTVSPSVIVAGTIYVGFIASLAYLLIQFGLFLEYVLTQIQSEMTAESVPMPIVKFVAEGYIWVLLVLVTLFWTLSPRQYRYKFFVYALGVVCLPATYVYQNLVLRPYIGSYTPIFWIGTGVIVVWLVLVKTYEYRDYLLDASD